jgi:hypothetical protein
LTTKEAFDLAAFRAQQHNLFVVISQYGGPSNPVYSGDIATAFNVNHRALKDAIEKNLPYLRKEFGPTFRMREKKAGVMRSLNGYFLTAAAIVPILVETLGEDLYSHCDKELLSQLMY